MKVPSPDKSFIDYSILHLGVRVRQASCRTIVLTQEGWEEYGEEIPLPVPPRMIDPLQSDDLGDLPGNVSEYERLAGAEGTEDGGELRRLLLGAIDLDRALRLPHRRM